MTKIFLGVISHILLNISHQVATKDKIVVEKSTVPVRTAAALDRVRDFWSCCGLCWELLWIVLGVVVF